MTTSSKVKTSTDEEFELAEAAAIKVSIDEASAHLPDLIEAAHRGELVYILTGEEFGDQPILLAAIGRKIRDSDDEYASSAEPHIDTPAPAGTRD